MKTKKKRNLKTMLKKFPGYFMSFQANKNEPTFYNYRFDKKEKYGISISVKDPNIIKRAIQEKIIDKPQLLRIKRINQKFQKKETENYYVFFESEDKKKIKEAEKEIRKIIKNYPEEIIEPEPLLPLESEDDDNFKFKDIPIQLSEEIIKYRKKLNRFYLNIILKQDEDIQTALVIDSGQPHYRILIKDDSPINQKNILEKNGKKYIIVPA
ncbi:hypothetical protein [Persephonella sp. KM09-Lau-8]|uniref:hypothetical protein n=1 Tax=Persephonella sp. KM09-Lau-8 TaxID=1158345 RepID=UPI0004955367|nr:hypothetical protein [Persephonella sp. KM09-Lau-8]